MYVKLTMCSGRKWEVFTKKVVLKYRVTTKKKRKVEYFGHVLRGTKETRWTLEKVVAQKHWSD